MITISLTEFLDFVIKSGTPKLTVVRRIKRQHKDKYHPAKDYYKRIRDGIVDLHEHSLDPSSLDKILNSLTQPAKYTNYASMIEAYKAFLQNKKFSWFNPGRQSWVEGDLCININPELGLQSHVNQAVKLYFKKEPLCKQEIDLINHLMQLTQQSSLKPNLCGVLDIRQKKLITGGVFNPALTPLLEGEAQSFAKIYKRIA